MKTLISSFQITKKLPIYKVPDEFLSLENNMMTMVYRFRYKRITSSIVFCITIAIVFTIACVQKCLFG